jgi:hypothetical protein
MTDNDVLHVYTNDPDPNAAHARAHDTAQTFGQLTIARGQVQLNFHERVASNPAALRFKLTGTYYGERVLENFEDPGALLCYVAALVHAAENEEAAAHSVTEVTQLADRFLWMVTR